MMKPIWINKRSKTSRIAKRLDKFLVKDKMMENQYRFRQWVGLGGDSDHFPVFF